MSGVYERLPDGSIRTAVPEPYWYRPWWAWFHWRPGCYECRAVYKTRAEYDDHYIKVHAFEDVQDDH